MMAEVALRMCRRTTHHAAPLESGDLWESYHGTHLHTPPCLFPFPRTSSTPFS